jgi:hypothetical protein
MPYTTLAEFVNGPGARKWVLVEQARVAGLRQALGVSARLKIVEARNNKFALGVIEREEKPHEGQHPVEPERPKEPFGAPP